MKLLKTLKHEFLLVLPPTIFFLVAFTLILATQRLILRQYGIPLTGFSAAVIGALLVGKVVLIVDNLPFVNKFPDKPLLYNTLWKTFIYFTAALLVRYLALPAAKIPLVAAPAVREAAPARPDVNPAPRCGRIRPVAESPRRLASRPFPTVFRLRRLGVLPLHVVRAVRAAAGQRLDVVDHIAGAGACACAG